MMPLINPSQDREFLGRRGPRLVKDERPRPTAWGALATSPRVPCPAVTFFKPSGGAGNLLNVKSPTHTIDLTVSFDWRLCKRRHMDIGYNGMEGLCTG